MEHVGARPAASPQSVAQSWEFKHAMNERGEAADRIVRQR